MRTNQLLHFRMRGHVRIHLCLRDHAVTISVVHRHVGVRPSNEEFVAIQHSVAVCVGTGEHIPFRLARLVDDLTVADDIFHITCGRSFLESFFLWGFGTAHEGEWQT